MNRIFRAVRGALYMAAVFGAVPAAAQLPTAFKIDGIVHIYQTWNNCGPATLSMSLSRWDVEVSQADIAALIRPTWQDGHVSIQQMETAAQAQGLQTLYIPAADLITLKDFVSAGFPVITPTWHIETPNNQMGHYRLVHGYDDSTGTLWLRDSLEPVGYTMDYQAFDLLWRVFNRRALVVFPADRAETVRGLLPSDWTPEAALQTSLSRAAGEVAAPENLPDGMSREQYLAYTDFNRAMALTALGRYEEAARAVRAAFVHPLPWRMLWYQSEVLESMYQTGAYQWIIVRTTRALAPYPYLEELWYWRGLAEAAEGDWDAAVESFRRTLEIRPSWSEARSALSEALSKS